LPIGSVANIPTSLARPGKSPIPSVDDLFTAAKSQLITYWAGGVGSPQRLATEMLKVDSDLLPHRVPRRAAIPTTRAAASVEVQAMLIALSLTWAYLSTSSRVKHLADHRCFGAGDSGRPRPRLVQPTNSFRDMSYVFPPPVPVSVPVVGQPERLPVHRVYCVGRNYEDHAKEMGFTGREPPFFFMKPATAVVAVEDGTAAKVAYPSRTKNLHYEVELVVAIGRGGVAIAPEDALSHVYGYAVGLDLTRRDLQNEMKQQGRPWCIGKAFEQSAPVGALRPAAQFAISNDANIHLEVNGVRRQSSHLGKMIWSVTEIIGHVSQAWELRAGDLIFCGTPEGVGPVLAGDALVGHIDGLSDLRIEIA